MPHTAKGEKILNSMKQNYGSTKKAEQVLHASANAGTITGIDAGNIRKMTQVEDPIHTGTDVAPHNAFVLKDCK